MNHMWITTSLIAQLFLFGQGTMLVRLFNQPAAVANEVRDIGKNTILF